MSHNSPEKLFQEEVRKRRKKYSTPNTSSNLKIAGALISSLILCLLVIKGCGGSEGVANSVISENGGSDAANPIGSGNNREEVDLPSTGILSQLSIPENREASLRLFLRQPLPDENSNLSSTCGDQSNVDNNYLVKLIDWNTDKVVVTAFVRNDEMVEMLVPFGLYKLRYAVGTKWYGEEELFGSKDFYEVTDKHSSEASKLEFTEQQPGGDISFNCINGNLGRKRVEENED